MSVTGLVVGVIGFATSFIPCIGLVFGILLGILGVTFSSIGLVQASGGRGGKGLGIAGLALSIITILWVPVYCLIIFAAFANSVKNALDSLPQDQAVGDPPLKPNQIAGICNGMTFGQKEGMLFLLVDGKERKIKIVENAREFDRYGNVVKDNSVRFFLKEDVIVTLDKVNGEDVVTEIRMKKQRPGTLPPKGPQIAGICNGMTFGQKEGVLFLLVDGKERKIKIVENARYFDRFGNVVKDNMVRLFLKEDVLATLDKVNGEDVVTEIRMKMPDRLR
jgi:hypothetical protein